MKSRILASSLFALLFLGAGCTPQVDQFNNTPASTEGTQTSMPKSDKVGTVINVEAPADLPTQAVQTHSSSKQGPRVVMKTTLGDITFQLFQEATPKTAENFLSLARQHFYDGTIFHRVIPDFMIQGGDPLTREQRTNISVHGTGSPGYKFADEFSNHKNVRGAISMANSGPNTNGSQFFIITAASTPWLDGKHAVFGEVVEGMDVVDKISAVKTGANDHPIEDIEILGIEIL